jgi:RNA polymerase sigma factor (sigma-70 family)
MAELSQAEQFLLDEIRQGSSDAWSQLVERYQGRLLAFARTKVGRASDAEDLVQDTFIGFLRALPNFRGDAGFETFLFSILRRRIISAYRGKANSVCLLQDVLPTGSDEDSRGESMDLASPDPTASFYARRNEDHELHADALAAALDALIEGHKQAENLRDLQIVEMLFYCQLRNKDIAEIAGVTENHVAVTKHRSLKTIRDRVAAGATSSTTAAAKGDTSFDLPDSLLTEIWQERRLSCLKRNTIGAYLLGTLEPQWQDYVQFHLDRLGCQFCRANLEDLQEKTKDDTPSIRQRIMQSTVGFLSRR